MNKIYLLDTNAFSEMLKPRPNSSLLEKFAENQRQIVTASVVFHELLYGLCRMPASRKKTMITEFVEGVRESISILPYDRQAADWHAKERRRLEELGIATSFADGQIAAIARTNDCTLVTHNLRHFEPFSGLEIETWIQ